MEGLPIEFLNVPYLQNRSTSGGGFKISIQSVVDDGDHDIISDKWRQIQGANDWVGLLNPFDPLLLSEIHRYGKFAQATYDAFEFDPLSKYAGSARYGESRMLEKVGLENSRYEITRYLYASIPILPSQLSSLLRNWFTKSLRLDSWSEDSNWMGYVAVSNDEETRRLGRRDILVAWRGTVEPSEWFNNLKWQLEPLGNSSVKNGAAKVERGFQSIYKSKSVNSAYTRMSASEQVVAEIRRLVDKYYGGNQKEQVSLTVTGHSLGGAIALLNGYEAAAAAIPGLAQVTVVTFGGPKVGNAAFGTEIAKVGVKVLRVVVKQDIVTKVPGLVLIPCYKHAGVEKELDMADVADNPKYSWLDFPLFHSLKTYLQLLEVKASSTMGIQEANSVQLVDNMPSKKVEEMLRTRACWYRMVDMGLLQGPPNWEQEREPEDLPSPPDHAQDADAGKPVNELSKP